MNNFNLVLLAGLLIWSSYSFIGFAVVGPLTASAFTCLQSSMSGLVPYAIIRVYQNSHSLPGIDMYAIQTIANAYTAGYSSDVYMEICRGIDSASQINLVNTEILTPMFDSFHSDWFVYIKVEPSVNPDCSWENYSQLDNCNYLKEAVSNVRNLVDWSAAVFSTAPVWAQFFGSSCDTFAADTHPSLWYADYNIKGNVNSSQSFDDFVSFGGWTSD